MIFRWLKDRRRRSFRAVPFPETWLRILTENVAVYPLLSEAEQAKLRSDMQVLIAEKNWEGCDGVEMSEEIKVLIAAQACLLVLAFEEEYFELVQSILVYPDAYTKKGPIAVAGGLVVEGNSERIGEAWYRGPVILSLPDVVDGARSINWGRNVVLHEFAHQLDMLNGSSVDGTPPLQSNAQFARWQEVNDAEYAKLCHACQHGRPTLIDCYGATNPAEFFAVTTEYFFQSPHQLATVHPELYDVLKDYYRQDPGSRLRPLAVS